MTRRYAGQLEQANSSYAGITDPIAYVNDRYQPGWRLVEEERMLGVPALLQRAFENGRNSCTLTSITAIFSFYREQGYDAIPDDVVTLQRDVRAIALRHAFTDERGTPPIRIAAIIREVWRYYGYTGRGSSRYVWTWRTFHREFKARSPFILNMANGYYKNHSVTGIGYLRFEKNGSPDVILLEVFDNRAASVRYIDFNAFNRWGSISRVIPPSSRP